MSVNFLRLMGVLSSDKLEDADSSTKQPIKEDKNIMDKSTIDNTNISKESYDDANDEIEEDWYSLSKDELIERLVDICNDYAEVVDKHTDLLNNYENLLDKHESLLNAHESLLSEHELLLDDYNAKCREYDELVEEYE